MVTSSSRHGLEAVPSLGKCVAWLSLSLAQFFSVLAEDVFVLFFIALSYGRLLLAERESCEAHLEIILAAQAGSSWICTTKSLADFVSDGLKTTLTCTW